MKKKIIGFTVLALGAITLAACSNSDGSFTEYKFDYSKGNNVDSITFKDANEKDITINKNDTYDEMARKFDYLSFSIRNSKNGVLPFAEKANKISTREETNMVTSDLEKDDNGKIVANYDKYTVYNRKSTDTRDIYENIYKSYSSDYSFNIGNVTGEKSDEYILDGKTLNSSSNFEYKNQGFYNKISGNFKNGGSVEFASNRMDDTPYRIEDENFDFDKEYKATYFNESFKAKGEEGDYYDLMNSIYKAKDYDITFDLSRINHLTFSSNYNNNGEIIPYATMTQLDENSYDYNYIKDYYELSFELTDKYLIIKNKFNASLRTFEYFEYSGLSYDKLAEYLKPYEGSYLYKEVWLDYKNIFNDTDTNGNKKYQLGYAYYKYDYVEKENKEGTYDSDTRYYGKTLNELNMSNLIGQKYTISATNETHIEAYLINVSDNEIESKKNAFVEECKKDNFLNKYTFEKTKKTSAWG